MTPHERIITLSNTFGVSGFEDEVTDLVVKECEGMDVHVDAMRNVVVGDIKTTKPRIMLDAHLDEVGLIVQAIKPNGTMRFLPLGGIQPAILIGQRVKIKTDLGTYVQAVVATIPPHFLSAAQKK